MQYAIRNTIVLAVLLLILIVGFAIVNTRQKKVKDDLAYQLQTLETQLENLKKSNPDYDNIDKIIERYEELQEKAKKTSKTIPVNDNPSLSYLYLLDICDRFSPLLDFDFEYVSSEVNADISFNTYNLFGQADIFSFYDFIYHLENQPMFYTVESLELTESFPEDEDEEFSDYNLVNFNLDIKAYYDSTGTESAKIQFRDLSYSNLEYNIFKTRVYEPVVDIEEEQYINLDASYMVGLTPEKVFIRDQNENINILAPGDRVAYGYLDRINWNEQIAIFKINKTGIAVEKKIYLNRE